MRDVRNNYIFGLSHSLGGGVSSLNFLGVPFDGSFGPGYTEIYDK